MKKYKYSGEELVRRYKEQYLIPDEVDITEDMVIRHWELEKELTRKLLESTTENRWETFDYCYSTLFQELDWLHKYGETKNPVSPKILYKTYIDIIGPEPKLIYEIGSGQGGLIIFLASLGHICRATEISKERGEKHVPENLNITWSQSDGIHLDKFEEKDTYDFVISNSVVEHLHPHDIKSHFDGVYHILKPGGKYIFFTIHKFYGPIDISKVFGMSKPMGMHLKEYMIYEFVRELKNSGFKKINLPDKVLDKTFYKYLPFVKHEMKWIMILEKILNILPSGVRRKLLNINWRIFPIDYHYIIAEK